MDTLAYLEEERKKLWEKTVELEELVSKKTSDYESEAMQASKKASEYRNRSKEAKETVFQYLGETKTKFDEIEIHHTSIQDYRDKVINLYNEVNNKASDVNLSYEELLEKKKHLEEQIDQLDQIFENEENIKDRIKVLEEAVTKGSDELSKITTTHKSIIERKQEIDEVYYEVFGYTDTDENGKEMQVEGLKDELSQSYNDLKSKLAECNKSIEEFTQRNASDYQTFVNNKEEQYKTTFETWTKEYKSLNDKIQGLLPNALTAGLSYAYSKKKEDEVSESEKLSKQFKRAISGLVLVSVIPFLISIVELFYNKPLDSVLLDMPRFVLSILPLYVPVLWLAYSANKKLNLSKRLIEEYTHKEVLSKTYEGLASQINAINDKSISADLKNKLLYNILEVASENPGKLISDYNKSDHPVMDALDKSAKLGEAVDRLSKIPGLSKLADILDKKSNSIVEKSDKLVTEGLSELSETIKKQNVQDNLLQ
jgi:hypothetical protein